MTGALFHDWQTGADFDFSRNYRRTLWRRWNFGAKMAVFIMLNPSTADETIVDPTVLKCCQWVRACGYGGLWVVNAFALRSTDPAALKAAAKTGQTLSVSRTTITFIILLKGAMRPNPSSSSAGAAMLVCSTDINKCANSWRTSVCMRSESIRTVVPSIPCAHEKSPNQCLGHNERIDRRNLWRWLEHHCAATPGPRAALVVSSPAE